jgi:hypothetical protein
MLEALTSPDNVPVADLMKILQTLCHPNHHFVPDHPLQSWSIVSCYQNMHKRRMLTKSGNSMTGIHFLHLTSKPKISQNENLKTFYRNLIFSSHDPAIGYYCSLEIKTLRKTQIQKKIFG